MTVVRFTIPTRTVNEANQRGGWRSKASRTKKQRGLAKLLAASYAPRDVLPAFPLLVTLTRVSAGLLDDDGVPSACKAIRDGIADYLGVDDKHRHIVAYEYAQQRGKRGEYAVIVEIRSAKQEVA